MIKLRHRGLRASELLQVACSRKQTLAWRFACRRCIREWSQDQHSGGREGSRIGQREKLGCDEISTKASVNPMRSSGLRISLHSFPELGWEQWPLYYATCEWIMTWGETAVFSRGHFLETGLLASLPTAGGINSLVLKRHLGGMSQNLLCKWSWDSTLGCLAWEFRFLTTILRCSM